MYISSMLSPNFDSVMVWERNKAGKRIRKTYSPDFSFFIPHKEGEYNDIYGNPLKRLEFSTFRDMATARKRYKSDDVQLFESDLSIEQKTLSQNYYNSTLPSRTVTFFDIEVDYDKYKGFSSVWNPYAPINSIALYHLHSKKRIIFAVPPQHSPYAPSERKYTLDDISLNVRDKAEIILCESEKELIDKFLDEVIDTDVLCGWNSDYFDIPYTYHRIEKILGKRALRRLCFLDAKPPTIRTIEREISAGFKVKDEVVRLFGRSSLDYKILFEKFEQENHASYALAYIAEECLPEMRKLTYEGSLYDLYRDDFSYYLEYNMIDTEILVELEKKYGYLGLTFQLAHMATGAVENVYGTIKLAELAIINYCHYVKNKRVPDSKRHDYFSKYDGAFVLDCMSGEHKWVGSVDVESLYPTGIMSTNASPETLIGQFDGDHDAYEALYHNNENKELTARMEGGVEITQTVKEWKDYLIDNNYTISGYGTIFTQNIQGFIPAVLESWFAERKEYKAEKAKYKEQLESMSKDDPKYSDIKDKVEYYHRLQYIKKIQLNSLYGCMGNKFFKFFDIRLAETTTKTGREILLHMARQIGKELDGEYVYPNDTVVYGDTDSCYFKTHVDNFENAQRVCKYIEKSINNSFPQFMKDKFFCNDKNASRTRVENEVISDIGIFVKKKIYLLHLVLNDGDIVDKMKIMGHAIKKTTLTPIVKENLKELIEEYFKTHDWDMFQRKIVDFKKLLLETNTLTDYGLPRKVNKVEKYTEDYEKDPTCRLGGGQAASIFWNICLKQYDDKESLPITSQMPIRIYYLEKTFGRFKSIAVPSDIIRIPDWFSDNFVDIIDRDAQVQRMVDMTLKNICEAVDEYIPSDKAITVSEVFTF